MSDLNSKHGRELARMAADHGFPWKVGPWPDFHNGYHLASTVNELAHELGHFLVAPPRRRTIAFFGLGHPSGWGEGALVNERAANREELRASLLGIALLWEVGDKAGFEYDCHEHGWCQPLPQMSNILAGLVRRGLMRQEASDAIRSYVLKHHDPT